MRSVQRPPPQIPTQVGGVQSGTERGGSRLALEQPHQPEQTQRLQESQRPERTQRLQESQRPEQTQRLQEPQRPEQESETQEPGQMQELEEPSQAETGSADESLRELPLPAPSVSPQPGSAARTLAPLGISGPSPQPMGMAGPSPQRHALLLYMQPGPGGPVTEGQPSIGSPRGQGQQGMVLSIELRLPDLQNDLQNGEGVDLRPMSEQFERVLTQLGMPTPLASNMAAGMAQQTVFQAMHQMRGGPPGAGQELSMDDIAAFLLELDPTAIRRRPADPETVAQLQTKVVDEDLLACDAECPICKEEFCLNVEVTEMPCHHCFHGECLRTWLKDQNTCPLCREEIRSVEPPFRSPSQRGMVMGAAPGQTIIGSPRSTGRSDSTQSASGGPPLID